ncbi:hypothetical protein G9F72_009590 [Clostridium estertheticum]|uniref:hypothetical protein n=1 Tax=Clostridium estertheticum TaxID=238834 RepID=UPI0013E99A7D|nr:hypothetical protein [Clostridium estertheticum]MBZ9686579.1 hypothetical protein [Clostridium estertheticum]
MRKFNNKDEEIYRDIFEKNAIDYTLQNELKGELITVEMSHNLKKSIMECTINKPKNLYEKFSEFLNRTIEIPVSYICTVCFVIFISSTLSTFIVTESMKMDKKLQGYTNIRVLNISGSSVILPKDISEVIDNDEN